MNPIQTKNKTIELSTLLLLGNAGPDRAPTKRRQTVDKGKEIVKRVVLDPAKARLKLEQAALEYARAVEATKDVRTTKLAVERR